MRGGSFTDVDKAREQGLRARAGGIPRRNGRQVAPDRRLAFRDGRRRRLGRTLRRLLMMFSRLTRGESSCRVIRMIRTLGMGGRRASRGKSNFVWGGGGEEEAMQV
ncbi:hypothetical protein RHGRI_004815 [Rhododendron griersonianum]|uniref:Uncharacterized protein n=1 Tax=Rhododendron griersonianum TaxID=479676 RepID=A0AAV6LCR1_9ERIC|nr:hypothetical protein RHGRI_004815 [Rhododendron griersonianum]